MMHWKKLTLVLAIGICACGKTQRVVNADSGVEINLDGGTDAGIDAGTDAGVDPVPDAGTDAGVDGGIGRSCSSSSDCSGAHIACDPADRKCKLDGRTTAVGSSCSSPADPVCGTDPNATCNTELTDGFPGGYCTFDPCDTVLCPIGSSCARLDGAPDPGCWKNCNSDSDCRTGYACSNIDPLYWSGASHKVCYLKTFQCAVNGDCPKIKPHCAIGPTGDGTCN